ncbi:MAG TPA: hypothetical protein VEW74_00335, partial [Candidatus Nitrosotalea sp.]|nr:hypothetical protein [Candidatus Nitrosotalea sp.]
MNVRFSWTITMTCWIGVLPESRRASGARTLRAAGVIAEVDGALHALRLVATRASTESESGLFIEKWLLFSFYATGMQYLSHFTPDAARSQVSNCP